MTQPFSARILATTDFPQAIPPVRATRRTLFLFAGLLDRDDFEQVIAEPYGDALVFRLLVGLFQTDGDAADPQPHPLAVGELFRELDEEVELGADDHPGIQGEIGPPRGDVLEAGFFLELGAVGEAALDERVEREVEPPFPAAVDLQVLGDGHGFLLRGLLLGSGFLCHGVLALEQGRIDGVERQLEAAMGVELGVDALDMGADRVLADEHQLGDLVVALALADQAQHLELGRGELVERLLLELPADDGDDAVHDAGHLVPGQPDLAFVDGQDGLRAVHKGEIWLPRDKMSSIMDRIISVVGRELKEKTLDQLTPTEFQVLRLIGQGKSNDEIAELMFISKNTVRSHIKSIYAKLDTHSRLQLALYAINSALF